MRQKPQYAGWGRNHRSSRLVGTPLRKDRNLALLLESMIGIPQSSFLGKTPNSGMGLDRASVPSRAIPGRPPPSQGPRRTIGGRDDHLACPGTGSSVGRSSKLDCCQLRTLYGLPQHAGEGHRQGLSAGDLTDGQVSERQSPARSMAFRYRSARSGIAYALPATNGASTVAVPTPIAFSVADSVEPATWLDTNIRTFAVESVGGPGHVPRTSSPRPSI